MALAELYKFVVVSLRKVNKYGAPSKLQCVSFSHDNLGTIVAGPRATS